MAKASPLGRLFRRSLLIVLIAIAVAIVYLWFFRTTPNPHEFDGIYQASVARASGDMRLEKVLGTPILADRKAAHYKFYDEDGHRHVRFHIPLQGPHRGTVIVGEAVLLGNNWLVVRLIATFPGHAQQINLTPGILT
jgi:hypothetical protein